MRCFPRLRSLVLLGVAFYGAGSTRSATVSELTAEFRAGQTFVTWRQADAPGQRYDIHRNGEKLATVGAHTALNVMATVDRMKLSNTRPPESYELPERRYFVVRDGRPPLASNQGLFVHTARKAEEAEYAVTPAGTAPEAATPRVLVREHVEFPQAVRQNETDFVHWTDNVGTPVYPAMSSVPSVPYNFRVRTPQGEGPFPLIAFLHGALMTFTRTQIPSAAKPQPKLPISFYRSTQRAQSRGIFKPPRPLRPSVKLFGRHRRRLRAFSTIGLQRKGISEFYHDRLCCLWLLPVRFR